MDKQGGPNMRYLTSRDFREAEKHRETLEQIGLEADRRWRNRTRDRMAREFQAAMERRCFTTTPRRFVWDRPVWYGIHK